MPVFRESTRLGLILRALKYRNYKLFFVGQSISLIGTWMTQVATGWLVYRLTGSALWLGIVGFTGQIATFLLAPLGGLWSDRRDCRRILITTQIISMVQSLLLAFLALSGRITVPQIAALSILQGLVNAFDVPARQAFVVQMIDDRKDLGNAIALNSSMFNGARLIGPAIAGLVIAVGGEGVCFLVDGISYWAVIWTLLAMRNLGPKASVPKTGLIKGMMEGIAYAASFVPIRSVLLLVAFVSLVGLPYAVLMPMAAREVFHGGPHTLGFLMSASGVGSLAGAVFLASRKNVRGLVRLIAAASVLFGAALIGFALSRLLWMALVALVVAGFAMIVQLAASNTVLQTLVDDDKRGRVMSLYMMAFMGMMPWGSLLTGFIADHAGFSTALFIAGGGSILGALVFLRQLPMLRAIIRPIYVRMGIIPEMAAGIESASSLEVPPEG